MNDSLFFFNFIVYFSFSYEEKLILQGLLEQGFINQDQVKILKREMLQKNIPLKDLLPCYSFIGLKTMNWVRDFINTQGLSQSKNISTNNFFKEPQYPVTGEGIQEITSETLESCIQSSEHTEFMAVHMVDLLFQEAIIQGISDIHLEPEWGFVRIRYRKDGQLMQRLEFHQQHWSAICVRLKVLAKLDIAEQRRPQSGRISYKLGDRTVDIRVSIHPTCYGENFVLRLLDPHQTFRSLKDLNFSPRIVSIMNAILDMPEGMILVTGPTGSGKTTTLYACLEQLSPQNKNIMTLEDPIEYILSGARQTSIQEGILSFSEGIRSILRQDPDIILIGEIRDEPTARMAIRAAMTGHQVLSTLHTRNSLGAFYRFQDLGISPSLLAGHLNAIVTQRLVRCLCLACRQPQEVTHEIKKVFDLFEIEPRLWKPGHCKSCNHQGYLYRRVLAEILVIDPIFERLLMKNDFYQDISSHIQNTSFKPLIYDALEALSSGDTSLDEIQRVIGRLYS
jgi:type II secretory ATPase GspE/PulE/Tfp pilus assembly ATPase PilB-like protein